MLRVTGVATLLLMAIGIYPVGATVRNVPDNYETIQAGIDASVTGDTVLVASGTYQSNFYYNGRNILLMSQSGPDSTFLEPADPNYPIANFVNGEGPGAILTGFTLRNSINVVWGSPVYIFGAGPLIYGNRFVKNRTPFGGGVNIYNGNFARISHNYFSQDTSQLGGGVYCKNGTVVIDSNTFCNNYVTCTGAAISLDSTYHASIHHNLIYSNRSQGYGGGIYVGFGIGTDIFNNTIVGNSNPEQYGGDGLVVWYSDSCHTYNNIVANNDSIGVGVKPPNHNTLTYNDVWGNDYDYYLSYALGPGEGSISVNPSFVGGSPYSYRLSAASLCIDAGDPNSPLDPDGTRADIGAFFGVGGPPPIIDSCYIAGILLGAGNGLPIENADIVETRTGLSSTSGSNGNFLLGPFENIGLCIIHITHPDFYDTTINHIVIIPGDTTYLDPLRLRDWFLGVPYILGDINGDGDATPLADIIYGVNYHGYGPPDYGYGPPPPIINICDNRNVYSAADIDGNCLFTGMDILHIMEFWEGISDSLVYCSSCRPPRLDTLLPPRGIDPGIPDSIIVGNLDGIPLRVIPGDTLSIPIWVKTDEPVAGINISLAIDTAYITKWYDGQLQYPLWGWNYCGFLPGIGRPLPTYSSQTLLGWKSLWADSSRLNTYGNYAKVAVFLAATGYSGTIFGDTAQIIAGEHSRSGLTAFCDSTGLAEWSPTIIGGKVYFVSDSSFIDLSRSVLVDTVDEGESISRTFSIANYGQAPLFYDINCESSWITVSPLSGEALNNESDTITININAETLSTGTYFSQINISSNDPRRSILILPIALIVTGDRCDYVVGDVNGSGTWTGQDVTYGVRFFKGGNPPPYSCECPAGSGHTWYVSGDVNGSCSFTGQDVTRMVLHFKSGVPAIPCPDCPPPAR